MDEDELLRSTTGKVIAHISIHNRHTDFLRWANFRELKMTILSELKYYKAQSEDFQKSALLANKIYKTVNRHLTTMMIHVHQYSSDNMVDKQVAFEKLRADIISAKINLKF
jgi:hypothetical protein